MLQNIQFKAFEYQIFGTITTINVLHEMIFKKIIGISWQVSGEIQDGNWCCFGVESLGTTIWESAE